MEHLTSTEQICKETEEEIASLFRRYKNLMEQAEISHAKMMALKKFVDEAKEKYFSSSASINLMEAAKVIVNEQASISSNQIKPKRNKKKISTFRMAHAILLKAKKPLRTSEIKEAIKEEYKIELLGSNISSTLITSGRREKGIKSYKEKFYRVWGLSQWFEGDELKEEFKNKIKAHSMERALDLE